MDVIKHYDKNFLNKDALLSIKIFYNKYPNFDLFFYKLINTDLNYNNDIDFLIHYYNGENDNENRIDCLFDYVKKHKIDFLFLKKFYPLFMDKTEMEIIREINLNRF
jgi:hypothetical protein